MSELTNLDDLAKSIREMAEAVKGMAKDFKQINKDAKDIAKSADKMGGATKGGKGKSSAMPASLAGFSYAKAGEKPPMAEGGTSPFSKLTKDPYEAARAATMGNVQGPARPGDYAAQYNRNQEISNRRSAGLYGVNTKVYAKFSQMSPKGQQIAMAGLYGPQDALNLYQGMSQSMASFMPSVQETMDRGTGMYNAGVYNRMSGRDVSAATRQKLAGGMTSRGSDANVAQFLSARGMKVGSDTYNETLGSVRNAARYMNISNEEAAQSVEGMTNASGAAQTLQNFGIYTADLASGKEKTQGQIFEELAQRLTAGRDNASVEETQASIRRGALGVTTDAFFQGDAQSAQMFKQYMLDRAGKGSSGKDAADQWDKGTTGTGLENNNPLQSQMNLLTSDTKALDQAQQNYTKGIETATRVLQALNTAAGGLAEGFMGAGNALQQTLFGHNTVQGMVSGADTLTSYAQKGVSSIMGVVADGNLDNAYNLPIAAVIGATAVAGGAAALGASGAASLFANTGGTGGNDGHVGSAGFSTTANGTGGTEGSVGFAAAGGTGGTGGTGGNEVGSQTKLFDPSIITGGHSVNSAWNAKRKNDKGQIVYHGGTDYRYVNNAPIRAIGDGKVYYVRKGLANKSTFPNGGLGNQVALLHFDKDGKKYSSVYGHMSRVAEGIKTGAWVKKGTVLGWSGNSGASKGEHLHFELRKGAHSTGVGSPQASTWLTMSAASGILASGETHTTLPDGTDTNNPATAPGTAPTADGAPPAAAAAAIQQMGKQTGPLQAMGNNALNMVKGLYSNDEATILGSMQTMSANMGVNKDMWDYFTGRDSGSNLGSGAGPGGNYTAPGKGVNNNNVSIIVQVPDVTAADATKFAQLVKQYLDEDSLISNTGGN